MACASHCMTASSDLLISDEVRTLTVNSCPTSGMFAPVVSSSSEFSSPWQIVKHQPASRVHASCFNTSNLAALCNVRIMLIALFSVHSLITRVDAESTSRNMHHVLEQPTRNFRGQTASRLSKASCTALSSHCTNSCSRTSHPLASKPYP